MPNETEHTKEPWTSVRGLISSGETSVASVHGQDFQGIGKPFDDEATANAHHLCACVNFCEGVPTKTLIRLKEEDFDTDVYIVQDENNALKAQVTALREALEKIDRTRKWHKKAQQVNEEEAAAASGSLIKLMDNDVPAALASTAPDAEVPDAE